MQDERFNTMKARVVNREAGDAAPTDRYWSKRPGSLSQERLFRSIDLYFVVLSPSTFHGKSYNLTKHPMLTPDWVFFWWGGDTYAERDHFPAWQAVVVGKAWRRNGGLCPHLAFGWSLRWSSRSATWRFRCQMWFCVLVTIVWVATWKIMIILRVTLIDISLTLGVGRFVWQGWFREEPMSLRLTHLCLSIYAFENDGRLQT